MRFVRYADLAPLKGIHFSREHLRRLEAAGRFPKRVKLADGGEHFAWVEAELDAYIAERMAAREGEAA
jgi:prophage regulatory protein